MFSPGSDLASAQPQWIHEAQTLQQPRPSYLLPSSYCSSEIEEGMDFVLSQTLDDSNSDICMKCSEDHGPCSHCEQRWDSSSLNKASHDTYDWTTTSSDSSVNYVQHDNMPFDFESPPYPPYQEDLRTSDLSSASQIFCQYPPAILAKQEPLDLSLRASPAFILPQNLQKSSGSPLPMPITCKPKVEPAHHPVPPEKRSSYSELAPNLIFLERLRDEDICASAVQLERLTITIPPAVLITKRKKRSLDILPLIKKRRRSRLAISYDDCPISDNTPVVDSGEMRGYSPSDTSSSGSSKNIKEPRKPSLACTFCRERKISCGRPPEGSLDPTCNQCLRRSFKCTYVNEQGGKRTSRRR